MAEAAGLPGFRSRDIRVGAAGCCPALRLPSDLAQRRRAFFTRGLSSQGDAFRIEDRTWRCHRNGSASNRNLPEIQIWLIGDHEGFKAGSDNKESDEHKSFACSRDGLRLRNKTDIQLGLGDTQPMSHGTFVGGYLFQLRSKRYNSHRFH